MLLLDTNHCFRIIARDSRLLSRLEELRTERVATSVIVAAELLYGAAISQQHRENTAAVIDFITNLGASDLACHREPLCASQIGAAGKIRPTRARKTAALRLIRLGFSDNDLWIAATSLERKATIVSYDPDFRRIA